MDALERRVWPRINSRPQKNNEPPKPVETLTTGNNKAHYKNNQKPMINQLASSVILFDKDGFGDADSTLRHKLASDYFRSLEELGQFPQSILFCADGVKLTVADSPCLPELKKLLDADVSLMSCQTSLDHYGLTDQLAIGERGSMTQLIEAQTAAARLITI